MVYNRRRWPLKYHDNKHGLWYVDVVSLPRLRIPLVFAVPDGPGRCPVLKRRADQAAKTTLDDYTSTTCYGRASA